MNATVQAELGIISSLVAVVLIVAGVLSYQNTQQFISANSRLARTNEVLAAISQTRSAIQGAQNRATDFAIVRDDKFRTGYYASVAEAEKQLDHLRTLASDSPHQRARLDELDDQIENAFSIFHLAMNLPQGEKSTATDEAQLRVREEECMDGIRRDLQAMEGQEQRLLNQGNEESVATAHTTIRIDVLGSVLALAILIVASAILHFHTADA
ncbi:MAG: CHASE3 domain-containing protein [Terriglobia bacterium]